MEKNKDILILTSANLIFESNDKKTSSMCYTDFRCSRQQINESNYILYLADNGELNILKHKFPIIINGRKIY